jgi:hypothetical protein
MIKVLLGMLHKLNVMTRDLQYVYCNVLVMTTRPAHSTDLVRIIKCWLLRSDIQRASEGYLTTGDIRPFLSATGDKNTSDI